MTTEETIQFRKTIKLRADTEHPLPVTKGQEFQNRVEELIALAGKAPFHHESNEIHRKGNLIGVEPWRFHALDSETCRVLLASLKEDVPMKASEGIKQMLAAADALILVTWLPERSRSLSRKFHPNVKNMEHIAATGAAIQNLLLAATSRGITNYWSSGGCLRKPNVLNFLGIPKQEILLGAVFLFPEPDADKATIIHGENREKRGEPAKWMDWVNL